MLLYDEEWRRGVKRIPVVAAVIVKDQCLLLCRRSLDERHIPGKWEFPGGKVENGETTAEAVRRELLEELELEVRDVKFVTTTEFQRDDGVVLQIHVFLCRPIGDPVLVVHEQFEWVLPHELPFYDMAPGDWEATSSILSATATF